MSRFALSPEAVLGALRISPSSALVIGGTSMNNPRTPTPRRADSVRETLGTPTSSVTVRLSPGTSPSPKNHLWHFSRGISFAATTSAASLAQAASPVPPAASKIPVFVPVTEKTPRHQNAKVKTPSKPQAKKLTTGEAAQEDESSQSPAKSKKKDDTTAKPPPPLLDFRISEDAFTAAKKALPGSPESFWSYSMYRGPLDESGQEQKVKIHYCRSKHTMERVCQEYFMDEPVIGFDLEWAPEASRVQGPRRNVSLIQLASPSRIALFHTAIFHDKDIAELGPNFRHIMESPDILKTGVAIKGDATRLRNFFGIDSRGLMELSHWYKLVTYLPLREYKMINRRLVTLALQVEEILHLPLYKGQDVRGSDWSKPLARSQIYYAASDAYAGPHLFATLEHMRKQLDPCPPRPHPAESNLPIRVAKDVELDTADEAQDEAEEDSVIATETTVSVEYMSSVLESITIEKEFASEPVPEKTPTKPTKANRTTPAARKPRTSKS